VVWNSPSTVVTGDIITAAWGNTYVRDNTAYLKGLLDGTGGAVGVTVPSSFAVENDALFGMFKSGGSPYIRLDSGDQIYYDRTNNILYFAVGTVNKLAIDSNGKITGAAFYSSGEVSLANNTVSTLSHGLPGRPRLITGFHAGGSTTEDGKTFPITPGDPSQWATPAGVYLQLANSTQLQINNKSGATIYFHVYAMY